jgi:hypothetical protein
MPSKGPESANFVPGMRPTTSSCSFLDVTCSISVKEARKSPVPTIVMSQQSSRAPSQSPSVASERELEEEPVASPRQQSRTRRRRRRTPRSASVSSEEPGPNYDNQRRVAERKSGLPAVNELGDTVGGVTQTVSGVADTATGAVSKVGDAVGNVAASVGGDKPLKLRLDINLDIEIELEARVHGDLTLALL